MSRYSAYEGYKFERGSVAKVTDPLTIEQPLQITINEKPFTVVMQTPGAEKELAYGLLFSEDVLRKNTPVQFSERRNPSGYIEEITVHCDPEALGKGYLSSRSLLSVSSCGICGKRELGELTAPGAALQTGEKRFSLDHLFDMQQTLFREQVLFRETGGCHGVAAFDDQGNMLALYEDIGRHNALDKVIGSLLFSNSLNQARVVIFSGRISYEIVSKCFRAKIPVVAAVSAPSSLAVDFAKEYGLTLLAFMRDGKATCYSNPGRIR